MICTFPVEFVMSFPVLSHANEFSQYETRKEFHLLRKELRDFFINFREALIAE